MAVTSDTATPSLPECHGVGTEKVPEMLERVVAEQSLGTAAMPLTESGGLKNMLGECGFSVW
jgi:hypothetical protein